MRVATASSSQKYLAALGFTHAMPIDKAMTKTLAATRYWAARVSCAVSAVTRSFRGSAFSTCETEQADGVGVVAAGPP